MKRAWAADTFLPPQGSLQRRLSLALGAGVLVLWLAATLAAGLIVAREIDEVFDSALQEVAQRVLPLAYIEVLNRDPESPDDTAPQQISSVGSHREYITYIVRDRAGKLLLQSHDADPALFPQALKPGYDDTARFRSYTEAAVQGTLFVTTAERAGHRSGAIRQAIVALIWPLALLFPLSLICVWLLVRRSLEPVRAFRSEIEARGRGNLSPVDGVALPAEISPVAEAVNRLLARLRRALEAERSFTANSAHELRTPIAAALAQTQRLLAEVPDGTVQTRGRDIEGSLHRLSRLSVKLLQLAKAEGGGLLSATSQDMAAVLRLVVEDFARDAAIRHRLALAVPDVAVMSVMDVDAFAILARNLIENALKHGSNDAVMITLAGDGVLSVVNGGSPIPPEVLERLRRPFERGDTGAAGSGLGLGIAEAIAQGSGGRLDLLSPASGRRDGFEARFRLPAA